MSLITLPQNIASGDADNPTRDMANWTTIRDIINGNLDDANISSSAAIAQSKLANPVLGYTEITANDTGGSAVSTEVDTTSLNVTVTVPSGGRRIRITAQANMYCQTSAADMILRIKEGSTVLAIGRTQVATANGVNTVIVQYVNAVSAGAHTYKLSMQSNVAGSNIQAAATEPSFILVETF